MSDESIKPPATSNNSLAPTLNYVGNKTRVTFNHGNTVNIYIVYEINLWSRGYNDHPVLENSLFGALRLTKNADIDKYKYSGYGIRFDKHGTFLMPIGGFGRNVIIKCC